MKNLRACCTPYPPRELRLRSPTLSRFIAHRYDHGIRGVADATFEAPR